MNNNRQVQQLQNISEQLENDLNKVKVKTIQAIEYKKRYNELLADIRKVVVPLDKEIMTLRKIKDIFKYDPSVDKKQFDESLIEQEEKIIDHFKSIPQKDSKILRDIVASELTTGLDGLLSDDFANAISYLVCSKIFGEDNDYIRRCEVFYNDYFGEYKQKELKKLNNESNNLRSQSNNLSQVLNYFNVNNNVSVNNHLGY